MQSYSKLRDYSNALTLSVVFSRSLRDQVCFYYSEQPYELVCKFATIYKIQRATSKFPFSNALCKGVRPSFELALQASPLSALRRISITKYRVISVQPLITFASFNLLSFATKYKEESKLPAKKR